MLPWTNQEQEYIQSNLSSPLKQINIIKQKFKQKLIAAINFHNISYMDFKANVTLVLPGI